MEGKTDGARLRGKRALVFGAGSGIGRASAIACAEEGAQVMLADLNPAANSEVSGAIQAAGGRAACVQADITEEAAVEAAVQATLGELGGLEILVTSAGGGGGGGDQRWQRHVELYLNGPF